MLNIGTRFVLDRSVGIWPGITRVAVAWKKRQPHSPNKLFAALLVHFLLHTLQESETGTAYGSSQRRSHEYREDEHGDTGCLYKTFYSGRQSDPSGFKECDCSTKFVRPHLKACQTACFFWMDVCPRDPGLFYEKALYATKLTIFAIFYSASCIFGIQHFLKPCLASLQVQLLFQMQLI